MNKKDIFILVRFNFWANGRVLAACSHLTADEFTRELTPDPGWGTLRGILVHTLDTEFGWRAVLQGQASSPLLEPSAFAGVPALRVRWDVERAAWLAYVAELTEASLNQGYGTDAQSGPQVWQTIMHVVTHGIQHRSEAAFILTGYGHSPGELDFDVFLRAEGAAGGD